MYQRDRCQVDHTAEDSRGESVQRRAGPGVQDQHRHPGQARQFDRVQDCQGEQMLHYHCSYRRKGMQEDV